MDWEKIIALIAGIALLIWLLPQAKRIFAESQQAEDKDWMAAILPLLAMLAFVGFLILIT